MHVHVRDSKAWRLAAALLLVFLLGSTAARADAARPDTADDKGTALALFEQGRALIAQGEYEKAARKFEGASRLLHTFGILFNLANCYEKLGRTASAWSIWREAGSVARGTNRADDEARAEAREHALLPQLSELTLLVPQAPELASLEVTRNGAVVPRPAWDSAIFVDPGEQAIDARAPGYRAQHLAIVVLPNGDKKTLTVPPLEPEPTPIASAGQTASGDNAAGSVSSSSPASPGSGHSARSVAGWITAGVGVAIAVGGIVEGSVGQGGMNDAVTKANAAIAANDRAAYNVASTDLSNGESQRTAGFVLLGVGAAAAVVGAVVALTAPRGDGPAHPATSAFVAPWLAPSAMGFPCGGRW